MKFIEKTIYEIEFTDEESRMLRQAKQFFDNLTSREWEALSRHIARGMGFDEEDWENIERRIDEVCEYFYTLPL
jgi:hypothetical protein